MGDILSLLTALAEGPAAGDLMVWTDVSDTTQAASGTTKRNEARFGVGTQVNPQTGTTYTYLTTDFRKLVTHTNAAAIAGTLPQAGASFPAGWFMLVQNRGAGALTITPTTSTIDGVATLVLSQNEGAIVVSDGTNYFTLRGKATGGAGAGYDGVTTGGTGSLDFAQGAKTADEPFIDGTVIWNNGAVTFNAIQLDVTDTASATASRLINLLVGGALRFSVKKSGTIQCGSGASNDFAIAPQGDIDTGIVFNNSDAIHFYNGGFLLHQFSTTEYICGGSGGVRVGDSQYFRFTNSTKLTCDSNKNGILSILTNGNTGGTLAITPRTQSQFTADVNNYAPTDSQAYFQRWSSDASRTVTGYQSWNANGEWKLIVNVGSNDIVLAHESASSTAANRFLCSTGANITLSAGQAADIIYDNTAQRWRAFKRN